MLLQARKVDQVRIVALSGTHYALCTCWVLYGY